MKNLFLSLLASTTVFFSCAQSTTPTENTLLWRISGKGLSRPSYLYGTMHLTDERLFNFSDSLLAAIQNNEGFAMELDPDEMMTMVVEQMVQEQLKSKLLKEAVSKKAFTKYAPLLAKRLHKPQDEITVKDVVQEQNKWMQDAYKQGTMPTFLDIYLYDIARRQGKWVGGVEDVQDQAGLLQDVFTESDLEFLTVDYSATGKKYLNTMIESYARQDLQTIEKMSSSSDPKQRDLLLLRRNVKMARRMDSLSAVRSMVFAVGAAHLPGDSGVISLLRRRGFMVTPIFSDKKIAGKTYKVQDRPLVWQPMKDQQGLFAAEMPGKASQIKMYGILDMYMNINLFTSSGYFIMAVPETQPFQDADSMILSVARNMMENLKLKQGEPVTNSGLKGREFFDKNGTEFKRAQLYASGQTIYVAFSIFMKENNMKGEDANRFFRSLTLQQPKPIVAGSMVSFSGVAPGIQGTAPVALTANKQMVAQLKEQGYDVKVFTGLDSHSGGMYMLINKTTTSDMYIPNDSIYLNIMRQNYRQKISQLTIDTIRQEGGNYTLEQKGVLEGQKIFSHSKSIFRGNRCYSLFAILPDGNANERMAAQVIQSFQLTTPAPAAWSYQSFGNQFRTWSPSAIELKENEPTDEVSKTIAYNLRDTNSSYVYNFLKTNYDSGTWFNSKKEYWDARLKAYTKKEDDTVLLQKPFAANGLEGYDLEIRKKDFGAKTKRYRLFAWGDTACTLYACIPTSDVHQPDVDRFFTDFKFTSPAPVGTIYTSKAASLLSQLAATDSATHQAAYDKLSNANFIKQDTALLHQALLRHYDWDSSSNHYLNVHQKLADVLVRLEDSTLTGFIQAKYSQTNSWDDEEKTSLLQYVADEPTQSNLRFVVNALKATDGNRVINTRAIYKLDDSLELVKPLLPEILPLLRKKNMEDQTIYLVKNLLDSNVLQVAEVLPYEADILAFGRDKLQEINKETDGWGYAVSSVAIVAGKLKTTASLQLLQQMIASPHNAVKIEGVYGLLEAGKPVSQNVLQSIAADRSLRTELWESLKEKHQSNLFPAVYKTQQALAEANLYDYMADDDTPSDMRFVVMRKTVLNGKPANVYIYKTTFTTDDEKHVYLSAIAYPASLQQLEALEYGYSALWDEAYEAKKQDDQIKTLLKNLKENGKSED